MNATNIINDIVDEEGFVIVIDGRWYRVDYERGIDAILLYSGHEDMSPDYTLVFERDEFDELVERMRLIAPLDEWQPFDDLDGS